MRTILLPTDFSVHSEKATEVAIEIAKRSNARILLVHSFFIPVLDINTPTSMIGEMYDREKEESQEKLKSICQKISQHRYNNGQPVETEYVSEHNLPAPEIVQLCNNRNPDLIVIGTEGRDHFLGMVNSTTRDVLADVTCPVLVIKKNTVFNGLSTMYYAMENIKEDINSVKQLLPFARLYDSDITIIHVDTDKNDGEHHEKKEDHDSFINAVRDQLNYPKISLHLIRADKVTEGLDDFLNHVKSDVIVLEKQQRSWLKNLFHKSVTDHLIKDNEVPLLIIH